LNELEVLELLVHGALTSDNSERQKKLKGVITVLSGDSFVGNLQALHLRGRCHFYLDEDEQAFNDWDSVLAKDPKFADVHHFKGLLLRYIGKKQEATVSLQEACNLSPGVTKYAIECAHAWEDLNQLTKAQEAYELAKKTDPQCISAYSGLGTLLVKLGKKEEGIASLQSAADLIINGNIVNQKTFTTLFNLGVVYFTNKNYEKALELFKLGADFDWTVLAKLVQCYSALKQNSERNATISKLYEKHAKGEIPQPRFCREQIQSPHGTILCYEFFTFSGQFGACKILFLWENQSEIEQVRQNVFPYRVSLGSYDSTNDIAREMGNVPGNQRLWHIDSYFVNNSHKTIKMIISEEPPAFDVIKEICIEAMTDSSNYLSAFIPPQEKEPPI